MAFATRADLLPALPRAYHPGSLPAEADARSFLAALLAPTAGVGLAPAEALPVPQLQIRSFSGAGRGGAAGPAGAGQLPRPGGGTAPAAGPLSTHNYLRLSFDAPLPAAVLAARPELWLFTYHNRRRPSRAGGLLRQAGWGHPCPAEARHQGAFWGGANPHGAATEFYGAAVQQSLALAHPYADIILDANHWFGPRPGQLPRPPGRAGGLRRFRFALVVEAPAGAPTPSGKRLGPLSAEVWLGYGGQSDGYGCAFRAPVYGCPYGSS